jgi:hypothetical protein
MHYEVRLQQLIGKVAANALQVRMPSPISVQSNFRIRPQDVQLQLSQRPSRGNEDLGLTLAVDSPVEKALAWLRVDPEDGDRKRAFSHLAAWRRQHIWPKVIY